MKSSFKKQRQNNHYYEQNSSIYVSIGEERMGLLIESHIILRVNLRSNHFIMKLLILFFFTFS
jgi:hypothetical protein